jgi:riboflavin kinase/FMN adenylyltransferase
MQTGWLYPRTGETLPAGPAIVSIGQFDGVHCGHQALIDQARRLGGLTRTPVGVVTFDRPPLSLLAPAREPKMLTRLDDKVRHLLGRGIDFVAVLTLSENLLRHRPEEFVDEFLGALSARAVVVGPNFRFGRRAAGDPALLATFGKSRGFDVHTPDLTECDDEVVSSTRVRTALADGQVERAAALLGRPHAVRGYVASASGSRLMLSVPANVALPITGNYRGGVIPGVEADRRCGEATGITVKSSSLVVTSAGTDFLGYSRGDEVLVSFARQVD